MKTTIKARILRLVLISVFVSCASISTIGSVIGSIGIINATNEKLELEVVTVSSPEDEVLELRLGVVLELELSKAFSKLEVVLKLVVVVEVVLDTS